MVSLDAAAKNSFTLASGIEYENSTPEAKVEKLVVKSNNRGGTDNISIAYLLKAGV